MSLHLPFEPPSGIRRIRTLDMHTGGEPLRVVVSGFPELLGSTILQCRRDAMENWDHLRMVLMAEPRGHGDMYGAVLMPPVTADGHFGVLFLHNAGWSTMCGHGIVALTTAAVRHGWVEGQEAAGLADGRVEVRFDTPAGRVVAAAERRAGKVGPVTFRNVASFVVALDQRLRAGDADHADAACARWRGVAYDLAFGGAFYAYVDAQPLGLTLDGAHGPQLIAAGRALRDLVAEECELRHPSGDPDLEFLYGVIFTDGERHACVFADGELDRSPTGTGVAGRAAIWAARGELAPGATRTISSVVDSEFSVRIVGREELAGGISAIVPEVTGEAFSTGRSEFWVEAEDPLGGGFFVGRGGC